MNVLLLRDRFPHMGQHSGYDQLSEALGKQSQTRIASVWRKRKPPVRGVGRLMHFLQKEIRATPFYKVQGFYMELSAAWQAVRRRFDIIHVLYLEDTLGVLPYLRTTLFKRVKLVATAHQPPSWWKINRLAPHWFNQLDALIVLDTASKNFFADYMDPEKIHVIPHGVAVEFFTPPTAPTTSRTCLYVGQWLRDLSFFEEVVRYVSEKTDTVRFELIFKPQSHDATNPLLIKLAQHPGVSFHPTLTDVQLAQLYREAALLTLPLLDSSANNALLEAMASGLPILSTDVGGVKEYLPADGARVFRTNEPKEFAEAILDLVAQPSKRREMGRILRQKAEAEYAWPKVASQVEQLYLQLTKNTP